jgi:ParB/RepB/Spo0J family partition protein
MSNESSALIDTPPSRIDPQVIVKNPNNPRRYFNEERLDQLRTSLQEVGVLVPLIVYRSKDSENYVLMDGERRWRSSIDLAMDEVPVNIIEAPSPLDNLLRMFNIHNVREDWPLISVALSLREVIELSGEQRESRLAEMTGLTRSTVRRAKRLLTMPDEELELIQREAHLDRTGQVHREDLYIEIEAADSVLRNKLPEIGDKFDRTTVIRQFAKKAEVGSLKAVTDFRFVGKLVKAADDEIVNRQSVVNAAEQLIKDENISPRDIFDTVAAEGYRQQAIQRKAQLLTDELGDLPQDLPISSALREQLLELQSRINTILESDS